MKLTRLIFIISLSLACFNVLSQQSTLNSQDISKVKIDELSDAQIQQIINQAEESGMTQQQLEYMVLSRGLPASELQKLKQRIAQLQQNKASENGEEAVNGRALKDEISVRTSFDILNEMFFEEEDTLLTEEEILQKKIFGFSLFNNEKLTFEPSLNIATPQNYQIGSGDDINIDIWGASQQNYSLTVNPEGYIFIDALGPVYVSGLTIEKANAKIKAKLSSIYSGLAGNNPNTFMQVSLGDLRSIKVSVSGDVNLPGTYSLPALATAFNALYYAGGPSITGSFRKIKIIRGGKEVTKLDLYDFLIDGNAESNIRLQDEDIVFVPPFDKRIEIEGEVIRPGLYESKGDETLGDMIGYAGGFKSEAYKARVKIFRKGDKEQVVLDVAKENFEQTALNNGDNILVDRILDKFANRVEIRGAVYRQGVYALQEEMTLRQLIEKAEGYREDAFLYRGYIYRLGDDYRTKVLSFDPIKIMNGEAEEIILKREDFIKIPSVLDLEEEKIVVLEGEVLKPGDYPFFQNMTLGDVILEAGGLLESASLARIEVARRIRNEDTAEPTTGIAEVFQFPISRNLNINDIASDFELKSFDVVIVRKSPGYKEQQTITVEGEVAFPGEYVLTNKSERISDIINRAGGFTAEAYLKGATLIREITGDADERAKALESIMQESEDSVEFNVTSESEQAIGIDLVQIMANPKSKFDLFLEEGDILRIPEQLQTVRLSGALLYPVTVRYEQNKLFRNYISQAGGFASNAKRKQAYVIYANGSVDRTKSFLLFRDYPKVEPGAEIVIPTKPEREGMSAQEWVGLTSVLSSTALIMVTIIDKLDSSGN